MLWVLVLDPVPRAARDIGRAEPLRHDALEPKLTSMAKHHVTRLYDVIVNLQPYACLGEQSDEQHPAALDRLAPQVIAVKLDQVERIKEHASIGAPVAQPVEHRHAIVVASYGLAIDQARCSLEREHGARDQGKAYQTGRALTFQLSQSKLIGVNRGCGTRRRKSYASTQLTRLV